MPVVAGKAGCSEGCHSMDHKMVHTTVCEGTLAKAGTHVPTLPKTTWFIHLQANSCLTAAGTSVPRSSENRLDHH